MRTRLMTAVFMAVAAMSASGADLSVPYLGLLTNGRLNAAGAFELSTRVDIDMMVQGGDAFDAWFKLGFRHASVEDYFESVGSIVALPAEPDADDLAEAIRKLQDASGLSLRTAAIEVKKLFGSPFNLSAFVGHLDTFCSGADFPTLFGTADFATRFRGYMYYPDGIGGDPTRRYDGLHEIYGTGLRLSLPGDLIAPFMYLYQDSWLGSGKYSADARILLNAEKIKLEAFAGGSFPVSTYGVYRAGLLFYYDTGVIGDFYAQIGVPRWDPTGEFGLDSLYFMFEPRVRFGEGSLTLSLFFHPAWYLQAETGESGAMEMRVDLGFGQIAEGSRRGGAELELAYDPNLSSNSLTIDAAPYFQTIAGGIRWDLRLGLRAFPFPDPWYGLFMPGIGISTAF